MRYMIEHDCSLFFYTEEQIDDTLSKNDGIDLKIYYTFDGVMYNYWRFSTRLEFEKSLELINIAKREYDEQ